MEEVLPALREPAQNSLKKALLDLMVERMRPVGVQWFKLLANPASRDRMMRGDLSQLRALLKIDEAEATPRYATIADWCALSGLSRSQTYVELGRRNLHAVKAGKRCLIDVHHGLTWLASLPAAQIRPPALRSAA